MTRILIGEDDEMMGRLYIKAFNFEGFQVDRAIDGQAVLDQARSIRPTLIILDVMMPRLNGLQTLDKLKSDPTLQDIPVVMLTNLASQQDAEAALAKGAAKYIIKSEQEPRAVVGLVRELLAASTPPATAPTAAPATPPANPEPILPRS